MPGDTNINTDAKIATIETRVGGLEKGIADLASNTSAQFEGMRRDTTANLMALRHDQTAAMAQVTEALRGVQNTVSERSRAPWGVIFSGLGVTITILIAIGGLAYTPILAAQSKLEARVEKLDLELVPRVEHVERWRQFERTADNWNRRLERLEFPNKPKGD